jgi:formamidopyrimidine-DNA glycosylase
MPELPDVEGYKRTLDANGLHRTIAGVTVGSAKILRGITGRGLVKALRGREIAASRRHGKHLLAALDDGTWLTLHFGMTGRLSAFERLEDEPPHDRLRLDFADGGHLGFVNQRLLGRVGLTADPDAFIAEEGLGPDALDESLDAETFRTLLAGRRGQVKAALMDQSLIAGVGNVYSDEILFQARLHPRTPLQDLEPAEVSALYRAMRRVLEVSIERGAGAEAYVDRLPKGYLLRSREEGARGPRCGGGIETLKAAGRTAYCCPTCQPPPKRG